MKCLMLCWRCSWKADSVTTDAIITVKIATSQNIVTIRCEASTKHCSLRWQDWLATELVASAQICQLTAFQLMLS